MCFFESGFNGIDLKCSGLKMIIGFEWYFSYQVSGIMFLAKDKTVNYNLQNVTTKVP